MPLLPKTRLVGLLVLLWAACAWGQPLTVVTEEYPPYNFQDSQTKKISGMATEVVEEVLKRTKIAYKLGIYPWARAYQMAQDAPNVLIYAIGRNEQRETLFKWVDVIAPYDVYLYRLKSRPEVKVQSVDDIRHYRIGAVRDDVRAQYLEKAQVPLDLVVEDSSNAKKLASRRIDLFPIDELAQVALYKREGMDPASVVKVFKLEALSAGLYMAFSKQTPDDLVRQCKAALAEIKRDGTFDKIRVKYLK
ncbi:transporter substrate-binding domain-containing protein [Rhodoferax sp. AJA081-3]|uniref:substrate-binding periplasmic protein n=1 Tax=Rhodoferax sp. AJA081-3 TaxID=2752316 RepID=UPI001AE02169|nr:transporter substrate-binding domain-containing protein [Rhodoferax sp. AJA081-3]QTN26657.1 transporter substrate-binding domain-containing protein [Rhodoferax sp. AJA081-3]